MLEVITRLDPEHWSRREPGMVRQFTVKPGRVGRHPTCGRCQGQQRGGGQQGQAGPRAGAVRSLPGLATAPGSRKSPCPGDDDARF